MGDIIETLEIPLLYLILSCYSYGEGSYGISIFLLCMSLFRLYLNHISIGGSK